MEKGIKCSLYYVSAMIGCLAFCVVVAADDWSERNSDMSNIRSQAYADLRRELRARKLVQEKVPPGGGLVPVEVGVVFTPSGILDVDDVRQVVKTSVIFVLNWTNPALAWNSSGSPWQSDVPLVEMPLAEIWAPHVIISNGAADDVEVDFGTTAHVSESGRVQVEKIFTLETICDMDLLKYPFDQQECKVSIAMYSSTVTDCRLTALDYQGSILELFEFSAEWSMVDVHVDRHPFPSLPGAYGLEYFMVIKRKTTFFVVSFITPIVMTSYMNTLVFLLPAESGERISYIVSIFVSNAVFLSFCTNFMPQGLDSVPLVMYLLLGIISESGILVMVNSLLLYRHHASQQQPHLHVVHSGSRDASWEYGNGHDGKSRSRQYLNNFEQLKEGGDKSRTSPEDQPRKRQRWLTDFCLAFGAAVINTVLVATLLTAMTN